MANSDYANVPTNRVNTGGGTLQADASGTAGQLSDTSVPCRVVYLNTSSSDNLAHWAVSSVNVSLGAKVPNAANVLIGIDDASKIWVFASTTVSVFASYLR